MAQYIDLNGVHMWYDDRGQGDPLVLLHGGLTDSRDFVGNLDALTGQFRVYLPERRGHGHTADVEGPLTLELMAQDTVAFLETLVRQVSPRISWATARVPQWRSGWRSPGPTSSTSLCSSVEPSAPSRGRTCPRRPRAILLHGA